MGIANNIEQVQTMIESVDEDGSGQIGFEEFCTLLNEPSRNATQRPIEALNNLVNQSEGVLSLQTAVPLCRRKHVLTALADYGSTRLDVRRRKVHEENLDRADIAVQYEMDLATQPSATPANENPTGDDERRRNSTMGLQSLHRQLLSESSKARKRLVSRERSMGVEKQLIGYLQDFQTVVGRPNTVPSLLSKPSMKRKSIRRKKKKRPPVVHTYTYAPGERIPHRTTIRLGEKGQRRPLRHVQPIEPKGSATGKVPKNMVDELERNMHGGILAGPPTEIVDPDWPIMEVFWRSFMPWAHVEGVAPPPNR